MTMTAPIALLEAPEMSVAPRKFVVREEVKSMTTATALDRSAPLNATSPNRIVGASAARRIQPRGIDRAVRLTAVAMLKWSRERESRVLVDHAERARRLQLRNSELQREAETLRLTQRIGL